ncbi:peptidoglycan-binding protein [Methanobrevibacter thaueri]|uniref:peptidoglycan-binding protein n=1 Tax=Methanobrevibacter thaueri TaxID=190975 RepID=UPI0026EF124D|nr:peptidoglycan-binding protein [Methanobrevibacter thaueri]
MKYKKTIILLALVVFLLSIAGVSASEIDNTIASEDTNTIGLSVDKDIIEDNLQTSEENEALASTDYDEAIAQTDTEVLGADSAKYSDLAEEISQPGNIKLNHKNYTYDKGGTIIISEANKVIDGNGAIIDMNESTIRAFTVTASGVTIKNLTIKNANYNGNGGAIYFDWTGTVSNCNFADNTATLGGAVYFLYTGTVTNCNFTNNTATDTLSNGGAVYFDWTGTVTNCNFTDNKATQHGGAVYFLNQGTVSNCNFADNSASRGGAILSVPYLGVTVDTCIFKTDSDTTFNTRNLPPTLNVDNFTTVYGSGEKLTFDLKTNSSIPVTNGNISISVYFKDNGVWVRNYTCLSGEGWIPDLPVGSYIAVFNTTYAEFQPINRTVTITMPNVRYSINVTSVTTNNKTVNITAKTDIPKDILWDGKLLFILPNGTQINATYGTNGTWWAVHKFDAYSDYQVNATYVGLDNVTITNATISISKTPTTITVENTTVELLVLDSVGTGAALKPADAGELTFTSSNTTVAKVEDSKIIAVGEGSAIITVSFAGNDDYAAAEDKTINVDVIKYDSKVTIEPINNTVYPNNVTIKYSIENKTNVTVTIDGVSDDKIIITNDTITVIGLDAGEYTITIINNESRIYHQSNDTKTFTVNKQATSITGADVSTTYNINKDLVITLKDSNGKALTNVKVTVDLNGAKTYTTDKNGQVKVSTKGLAPKAYTAKITFNGNTNYEKSAKNVKVTVKKATPKLTAKKKTFKTSVKTKKYTITLKDNAGKAIKKAKVTLKVKGKTYKATTNSKGKAVFKIKNLKKKGTFKATITYKGNKYYNKVSKKANIKVIVTFKTVSKGSKDKATVKEIQQALKDHGYYLSYKGHYLKVDGKFQSCTERSVKEFQHDKGLKVTGKVDEKTAKKLGLI